LVNPVERQLSEDNRHFALLHQLSERLTAAADCLKAVQRQLVTETRHVNPPTEVVDRTLAQVEQAGEMAGHLRKALGGSPPADRRVGRSYRVCFMNRFARGRNTITVCQRNIVIPSAESCEAAIEVAKQRFAELEGIPNWQIHASFIEAGPLEDNAATGRAASERRGSDREVSREQFDRDRGVRGAGQRNLGRKRTSIGGEA
jgi:hypothetical protein